MYALRSLKFKAMFSYPLAVTANKTWSSLSVGHTSSIFCGVIIINSTSFKDNGSGLGTIGFAGVTYSVCVTIFAGGCTGLDEHAASEKIIINPRTFTVKCFTIFSAPFFISQWGIR